jgi:hypothetical protein
MRHPSSLPGALLLLAGACSANNLHPGDVNDGPAAAALDQRALDALIEESWRQAGVTPSPPASDGEFLRRVTFDLAGRPPSLGETRVFLADTNPDKRTRLVDRLLASVEFGEQWADRYANLLWHEQVKRADRRSDPRAWLVQAFNDNAGYDKISGVILAGRGDVREHGGLTFITDRLQAAGPEGLTASVARVFLGLQIQCAQCHDHPYDARWKQEDFWGLVAYFAGTRVRQDETMVGNTMGRTLIIRDEPGVAVMPVRGYTEGVIVKPRFLGYQPTERPNENLRHVFFRAVMKSDLFPKAMVTRTWSQLLGHGLVDPWDDLGGENDAQHPPLLNKLAADFRGAGFNIKRLVRQIVLSAAYARGAAPPPGVPDDPRQAERAVRAFARAGVRTLSAEQLFRALVVMTGADVRTRHRTRDEEKAQKQLFAGMRDFRFAFDDDEMGESTSFDGSIPQALMLLNGDLTNDGARTGPEGVLGGILRFRQAPADRLDDMMLAAYGRKATEEEQARFLPRLPPGDGPAEQRPYEDLFFALTISTEALTNH